MNRSKLLTSLNKLSNLLQKCEGTNKPGPCPKQDPMNTPEREEHRKNRDEAMARAKQRLEHVIAKSKEGKVDQKKAPKAVHEYSKQTKERAGKAREAAEKFLEKKKDEKVDKSKRGAAHHTKMMEKRAKAAHSLIASMKKIEGKSANLGHLALARELHGVLSHGEVVHGHCNEIEGLE